MLAVVCILHDVDASVATPACQEIRALGAALDCPWIAHYYWQQEDALHIFKVAEGMQLLVVTNIVHATPVTVSIEGQISES